MRCLSSRIIVDPVMAVPPRGARPSQSCFCMNIKGGRRMRRTSGPAGTLSQMLLAGVLGFVACPAPAQATSLMFQNINSGGIIQIDPYPNTIVFGPFTETRDGRPSFGFLNGTNIQGPKVQIRTMAGMSGFVKNGISRDQTEVSEVGTVLLLGLGLSGLGLSRMFSRHG
jgi:hypothetical protein